MQELVIGGIYKHFKGHVYKVLCVGKDAEDLSYKNRILFHIKRVNLY